MDHHDFARRLCSGYGLVELPLPELETRLATLEPPGSQVWTVRRTARPSAVVRHLNPLTHPARHFAFVPVGPSWCAVVDNRRAGPEFADLQRWLRPWDDVHTIRVIDRPGGFTIANGFRERTSWSARIVEVHGPRTRRSITCADDGGRWVFRTDGVPLPVEADFPYEARRRSDRFGSEQLEAVLQHLGTRRLTEHDLFPVQGAVLLEISSNDPGERASLERSACTPEEADDPAFGYWGRAATWIDHMDTHASSVVWDLTRAVALNPSYARRARRHLERARKRLGASAYDEAEAMALAALKPVE